MTLFELVRVALDELDAEANTTYQASTDSEIKKRMEYLSNSYKKLSDSTRQPVNYKDPATRFAYTYKYAASHGDYIVQVLEELRATIGNIFSTETVRLSCVGGGPGSDIIAVLKYLAEYKHKEPVKKVTCYLLDREQAWADTWTELDESLSLDFDLNVNFQPLDVTDSDSWKLQKKFLQADLFTMSFFVSEVMALDSNGKVSAFWAELFKNAKSGAFFLYIDNGHDTFNDYFDKLTSAAGLKTIISTTNEQRTPRYSEKASELAKYTARFGQWPKLKGQLSYRVLQKP